VRLGAFLVGALLELAALPFGAHVGGVAEFREQHDDRLVGILHALAQDLTTLRREPFDRVRPNASSPVPRAIAKRGQELIDHIATTRGRRLPAWIVSQDERDDVRLLVEIGGCERDGPFRVEISFGDRRSRSLILGR
jgi:hypothetical protein